MVTEDEKRRPRPRCHYTDISDDILPALRSAGVQRGSDRADARAQSSRDLRGRVRRL